MVKLNVKHWQDPVTLMLGLWMLVSPWVLGYEAEKSLMWSGVVLGALITLTALVGLFKAAESAEWTNAVLGLCGVVSRWIPAVSSVVATANAVTVGISVGGLALWALSSEEPVRGSRSPVSNLPTDVRCHRRRNRAVVVAVLLARSAWALGSVSSLGARQYGCHCLPRRQRRTVLRSISRRRAILAIASRSSKNIRRI
jgi:hypothetical protein